MIISVGSAALMLQQSERCRSTAHEDSLSDRARCVGARPPLSRCAVYRFEPPCLSRRRRTAARIESATSAAQTETYHPQAAATLAASRPRDAVSGCQRTTAETRDRRARERNQRRHVSVAQNRRN